MPTLYGTTPKFGIEKPENGILVESLSYDGKIEKYEQKNHIGKNIGVRIIDETISFSMSGALPLGDASTIKMGSSLLLNNVIPNIWSETPPGTTSLIEAVKHGETNNGPVKLDVSGTIYAFGNESELSNPALLSGSPVGQSENYDQEY